MSTRSHLNGRCVCVLGYPAMFFRLPSMGLRVRDPHCYPVPMAAAGPLRGAGRGGAGRGPAPGGRGGRSPLPQPAQGWKRPSAGLVHDSVTAAGRERGLGQYKAALALAEVWDPWPARPGLQSQPQDAFKFSVPQFPHM